MTTYFPSIDFQAIFGASPDLYLVLLPDTPVFTIVAASDSYLRAMMTTGEQIIGRGVFDAFPCNPAGMGGAGVVNLAYSLEQVISKQKPCTLKFQQYDIRRPAADGGAGAFEERWWNIVNTPVILEGDVRYIVSHVEDVTQYYKTAQERERLSKERDRIFNASIDMMMIINMEGKILHVNRAWVQILGWQAEEVIGQHWSDYMHPSDLERTYVKIAEIFSKPAIWEMEQRYRQKNGNYRWLRWRGESYPEEKLLYVAATDITEHKTAEEKLRRSEDRLNVALEASQFVGTWEWDIANDRVFADTRFAKLFSLNKEQAAQGVPPGEYLRSVHPDDREWVESAAYEAVRTGNIYDVTYRLIHEDGVVRWIHARGRVQVDKNGRPICFPGVAIDITPEREILEALERSEQHWRTLAEAMPHLVWIAGAEGWCEYLSSQWEQYSGRSVNTLLGYKWLRIIHPDDQECVVEAWERAIEGKADYNIELRIRRHDGVYRWFKTRGMPFRNEAGVITIWYGTCTDIEDQKQASEDFRKAKERLQLIIESAKDFAIITLDKKAIVTSWNQGAIGIFGYMAEEMVGQNIARIFTSEDRTNHVPEEELAIARDKGSAEDERWHMRKDGTRFFASGIMTAMYNDVGQLQGFTKIARDITDKKYYEQMLIEARNAAETANQAKSEFLANMSHEIRTPMNSIIASTELLLDTALTREQQEYTQTIHQGGEILLSLINDILDFSKIEAGEMELHPVPFSVMGLVEEIVQIFKLRATENNVQLLLEQFDDIPSVIIGDNKRLRQVIFNLVGNAIKFTKEGTIKLRVIKVAETSDAATIRFEVEDTGIGIPPDKINSIFEKFVQATSFISKKYGGTGLGLAITKELTELMGGTIRVSSELGKGSCFSVEIPFKQATVAETSAVNADVQEKNVQLTESVNSETHLLQLRVKVLLAEDYPPNQKVARAMLEKMGCLVDVAGDGEEVIEKLHEDHYDIVLMDCQMPQMDGFEATRLIRQDKALAGNIIIAMTANALEGDKEKCIAAGMDDYIAKPIRSKEIMHVLQKYSPKRMLRA